MSFFPFIFEKGNQENQKEGLPSLPGDGWGGEGRVRASCAKLDLYSAGCYYFSMIVIMSAVLYFII